MTGLYNGHEPDEQKMRAYLAAQQLKNTQPTPGIAWRRAAVLLPLVRENEGWSLLYIRRSETMQDHKGQVAFPGGGVEAVDANPDATALREAQEEVGLNPASVSLLGRLSDFVTFTHFWITPVVGIVPWPFTVRMQPEEVSRVFTIPLRWLRDPANWYEQPFGRPDGRLENVILYQRYDGEQLWGITARITHNLLEVLRLKE